MGTYYWDADLTGLMGLKAKRLIHHYGTVPVKFLNKVDLSNNSYIYYKPFDAGINILADMKCSTAFSLT